MRAASLRRGSGDPVHISLAFGDGQTFGIGMPVVAYFSREFTDARTLQQATTVRVNGRVVPGAWYFQPTSVGDAAVVGHLRLREYWPANSRIDVVIAARGLTAGPGLVFDDSASFHFRTGPAQTVVVDGRTNRLVVYVNGRARQSYPVSLGADAANRRTESGTKVIMEQVQDTSMRGPGYFAPHVYWDQRLTVEGEYLHAAPWNTYNIDHRINSSHGCTNLHPADAQALFGMLRVGVPVSYVHLPYAASPMSMDDGWADWNLSWPAWLTGGSIRTR